MRIKTFWDVTCVSWLELIFHRDKQWKLLDSLYLKLSHTSFLSHNFLAFFKHMFPHTKPYGKVQHSPFMYVRSESVLFPNTEGLYTPLIITQTFCSSLLFSKLPLPQTLSCSNSQSFPNPCRPTQTPCRSSNSAPSLSSTRHQSALLFSNLCFPQGWMQEKSYIHNPSLLKQMPRHLKAQRITSSTRLSAEKWMYRQLKIFCYRF